MGRSAVLVIGTLDPLDGSLAVTVTASTVRPLRLWFPLPPTAAALGTAIGSAVADDEWFDALRGLPEWRRHMTFRYAQRHHGRGPGLARGRANSTPSSRSSSTRRATSAVSARPLSCC